MKVLWDEKYNEVLDSLKKRIYFIDLDSEKEVKTNIDLVNS